MSDILNFLRAYPDDAAAVMSKARVAETIAEIKRLRAEIAAERGFRAETERQLQASFDRIASAEAERDALRAELAAERKAHDRLKNAARDVLDACDKSRMVPTSGVGGMTIEANIRGSAYLRVWAWPVEHLRNVLEGIDDAALGGGDE